MRARLGLNLAAAVAGAGTALTAATVLTGLSIAPARADVGWSDGPSDVTHLQASPSHADFGAYMYSGSNPIVLPPRTRVTVGTTSQAFVAAPGAVSMSVFAFAPAGASAHIAWCEAHYRSYDVISDSFRGYDGLTHRCLSPE